MNQKVKVTTLALAAVICMGAAQAKADQTNLVQQLNIRLESVSQGASTTNRNVVRTGLDSGHVGTPAVIRALGAATGNTFSQQATLVVITPLQGGNSAIVVRDGSTSVDVSSFFVYEAKSGFLTVSELNLKTGHGNSTDYSVQHLALVDSPGYSPLTLHFDVQGMATETSVTTPDVPTHTDLDAAVTGWGDQGGTQLLLQGTFRVHGFSLEVVTQGPPNV